MDSLLASDVYPGTPLRSGSRGDSVRKMQSYLNVIGNAYPSIPKQTADSIFGPKTQQAVTAFQQQFGLTADGVIGENTWNKIVAVYREVSGTPQDPDQYPGSVIDYGASGPNVVKMQNYLNQVGIYYPTIPRLTVDGRYGNKGQNAVAAFQKQFGLAQDSVIGEATWNRIVSERNRVKNTPPTVTPAAYPGVVLQMGSQGSSVVVAQNYLNYLASRMAQLPTVSVDGVYGTSTQTSVIGFQKKYGLPQDGKIGPVTWNKIAQVYAETVNNQLPPIEGDPNKFPGVPLRAGSRGDDVTKMQTYLSFIGLYYTSIPATAADGIFGTSTDRASRAFQQQFGLPVDGIIGENTWNKIVEIYGELQTNPQPVDPDAYPGTPLQMGSRGGNVSKMQNRLNFISRYYTSVSAMAEDGIFGTATQRSVRGFQQQFGLTADGIIGEITWYKILDVYNDLQDNPPQPDPDAYPGTPLRVGSRGVNVTKMQTYLNFIGLYYTSIPQIGVDGIFGTNTDRAVRAFQRQFGLTVDGIIGEITWNKIVEVYKELQIDPQDPDQYPGSPLEAGSTGANVTKMQNYLNSIGYYYPTINRLTVDGNFGTHMYNAVEAFQRRFGLTVDGIIGENTWDAIVAERTAVVNNPPALTPIAYPGTVLQMGSQGSNVVIMQNYLQYIATKVTSIPTLTVDGNFESQTQASVRAFQRQYGLSVDGEIGATTWNKIVEVYIDLMSGIIPPVNPDQYPGDPLRLGSTGANVTKMQNYLNSIGYYYPTVNRLTVDGNFGNHMYNAVVAFQRQFGLTADGVIGENTWNAIVAQRNTVVNNPPAITPIPYPGTLLQLGSQGSNVVIMQNYLQFISTKISGTPTLTVDGVFGTATQAAVADFQSKFGLSVDGKIGPDTWNKIVSVYIDVMNGEIPPVDPDQYPGTLLKIGSSGSNVLKMQNYLNSIGYYYPTINRLATDGQFGNLMYKAVVAFQRQFGLNADGVIGPITWNSIVAQHRRVVSTPPVVTPIAYPGTVLQLGSQNNNVVIMQNYLQFISTKVSGIPGLTVDGVFGSSTQASVRAFQQKYGLTVDGKIGPNTWNRIVSVYIQLLQGQTPSDPDQYPGTVLEVGSTGEPVQHMQSYLNKIRVYYPSISAVTEDGVFGSRTQSAVTAFQRLFGLTQDGKIGEITWDRIVDVYHRLY